MQTETKAETPCRKYMKSAKCADGRDHCFNCGRHLDDEHCPRRCGEGNEAADEAANQEE